MHSSLCLVHLDLSYYIFPLLYSLSIISHHYAVFFSFLNTEVKSHLSTVSNIL
jgi:hypothetical protein